MLLDRTTSAFPLSIGTSLAIESLFEGRQSSYDPSRVPPERIQISKYNQVWINIATLYRNILGAIDKNEIKKVHQNDLANTIIYEMQILESIFQNEGANIATPIFYINSYKSATTLT